MAAQGVGAIGVLARMTNHTEGLATPAVDGITVDTVTGFTIGEAATFARRITQMRSYLGAYPGVFREGDVVYSPVPGVPAGHFALPLAEKTGEVYAVDRLPRRSTKAAGWPPNTACATSAGSQATPPRRDASAFHRWTWSPLPQCLHQVSDVLGGGRGWWRGGGVVEQFVLAVGEPAGVALGQAAAGDPGFRSDVRDRTSAVDPRVPA
ncbi:hypothetical protein [Streptomyces noursei]|uniref:hypothetical protein n=1 Tax=Streptomyces noursei TaxID=1971 RepID=UPI0019B6A3D0|nr:hypothetical protein GCM10010341_75250 [Streptomyces noursei]